MTGLWWLVPLQDAVSHYPTKDSETRLDKSKRFYSRGLAGGPCILSYRRSGAACLKSRLWGQRYGTTDIFLEAIERNCCDCNPDKLEVINGRLSKRCNLVLKG